MASKRRRKKNRKTVFIIEIIILVLLSAALFAGIWFTQKLSLLNHTELDSNRVITANEANQGLTANGEVAVTEQEQPAAAEPSNGLTGIDVIALVGLDTRTYEGEDASENSDTMIIACVNHNTKNIKLVSVYRDTYLNIGQGYYGESDYYTKANAAYNIGGPEQFLTMLNLNFDLNITQFVTVDFTALASTIDLLGGLDIEMTREELIHLNNHNVDTSRSLGVEYQEIEVPPASEFDGLQTRTFHLSGSQAVSYARIRYTQGNDFRRASRQRRVLAMVKEKASTADIGTIVNIINAVLPYVTTNLDSGQIISLATAAVSYSLTEEDQTGFPFVHLEDDGSITGEDAVLPVTLAYNVQRLHALLFPDETYYPSETVLSYSAMIAQITGYDDSWIDYASTNEDNAEIPIWNDELQAQADAAAAAAAAAGYTEESYDDGSSNYYDDGSSNEYYDDGGGEYYDDSGEYYDDGSGEENYE